MNLEAIIAEAKTEARKAATEFFNTTMNGEDRGCCGFAWVNIYKHDGVRIKGNTKMGRAFKAAGVDQSWDKHFQIWNPSGFPCQNIDTLEAGARAAADVFKKYGFEAYAGSRLD